MIRFSHKGKINFLFAVWIALASFFAPYQAVASGLETAKYYEKCKSLREYTSEANQYRWWEKPFKVVSEAAVKFGDETFTKVADGAVKLAGVGFGLWLAVFCMKWVGSMTETDGLANATQVGGMAIKLCIAAGLLKNKDYFFGYFVVPILDAGAGMAGLGGGGGSGLGATIQPMHQIIENAHLAIVQTRALGDLAMCISHIYTISFMGFDLGKDILDPSVWSNGCAVWTITWFIMVCWPILIFDALFRLGITAAFCPLFIVAWVFPVTSRFATKGLNSFLNIAFFYVCLNFAVKIGMKLLEGASGLDSLIPDSAEAKTKTVCLLKVGGSDGLSHCDAYAGETTSATGLMVLTACGFYCILFLKEATTFANYFSDAQFGNNTAFQAAKAAATAPMKAGKMAMKSVKAAGWAKDKINKGLDRRAARTLEQGRKSGGNFKSAKEQRRYLQAEERLRDRGYLDRKTGAETKAYGDLLRNGNRRQFANVASRVLTLGMSKGVYQNNDYKTWAGPRKAEDVKGLQDKYADYIDKKYNQ